MLSKPRLYCSLSTFEWSVVQYASYASNKASSTVKLLNGCNRISFKFPWDFSKCLCEPTCKCLVDHACIVVYQHLRWSVVQYASYASNKASSTVKLLNGCIRISFKFPWVFSKCLCEPTCKCSVNHACIVVYQHLTWSVVQYASYASNKASCTVKLLNGVYRISIKFPWDFSKCLCKPTCKCLVNHACIVVYQHLTWSVVQYASYASNKASSTVKLLNGCIRISIKFPWVFSEC